ARVTTPRTSVVAARSRRRLDRAHGRGEVALRARQRQEIHDVALRIELARQRVQIRFEPHAGEERGAQVSSGTVAVELRIDPAAPEVTARLRRLELVHHVEAWVDSCLHRTLAQQTGGEGMNRRHDGAIEIAHGRLESRSDLWVALELDSRLELTPQSKA